MEPFSRGDFGMPKVMFRSMLCLMIVLYLPLARSESQTTGFDFLRVDMGARPAAMGGAFVAVTTDLHGLIYNPASLLGIDDWDASFTFHDYLLDINSIRSNTHLYPLFQISVSVDR